MGEGGPGNSPEIQAVMKRGMIYWINLEPSSPPEFGKTRPALILSNSIQNTILPSGVCLPISGQGQELWPLRLGFRMPGTSKMSFVVIPGIRQVSWTRLGERVGSVSTAFLKQVEEAVMSYLGD